MHTSILTRGVIAVAGLAIGSAVLAAPSPAATASGITRAQVLAATDALRTDPNVPGDPSLSTLRTLRVLVNRACAVKPDDESAFLFTAAPWAPTQGAAADGLLIVAAIGPTQDFSTARGCVFGVLAAVKPATTLSGKATLTAGTSTVHDLSGDVFVTPPRLYASANTVEPGGAAFSVPNGIATTTTKSTTTKTVSTPKTKAQKKAAKKTYAKRLKAAKKAYKKALAKAGHSASKRAAAKAAYRKRVALATSAYKKAIATKKVVKTTKVTKTPVPFTFSASFLPPPD